MDVAMLLQGSPEQPRAGPSATPDVTITNTLKRRASSISEGVEDSARRKKAKGETEDVAEEAPEAEAIDGQALADELEQELQCGCCSALVHRPVVVSPCQHFFCGSCIVLWIKNGGTNCPACRGVSTSVTPSRPLQTIADMLVRAAPSRARSINERMQADEVYKAGSVLRIPTPRQASPEPNIPQPNPNFVQPCPHCVPGNQYDWRCPQPIVDPEVDPDNAWRTDDGSPPGHAYCGNCENILALRAPSTTRCDFCQVSFCGIGIPGRCSAALVHAQHPHGLADIGDLIQCGEIYEIFDGNTYEVDVMLDYLQSQGLTPKNIYQEIIAMILRSPRQFAPLIEADLFVDVHGVAPSPDTDPSAPRNRICRVCATEILLWGLREWWIQERKKGFLDESIMKRPDCAQGSLCPRQKEHGHAREFNHLIAGLEPSATGHSVGPDGVTAGEQARPVHDSDLLNPTAAAPATAPLILPVTDAGPSEVRSEGSQGSHGAVDTNGEQSKAEDRADTPIVRQSSIFKLLSPSTSSFGSHAPLAHTNPDSLPLTSQDAQAEVEAMI